MKNAKPKTQKRDLLKEQILQSLNLELVEFAKSLPPHRTGAEIMEKYQTCVGMISWLAQTTQPEGYRKGGLA